MKYISVEVFLKFDKKQFLSKNVLSNFIFLDNKVICSELPETHFGLNILKSDKKKFWTIF